MVSGMRRRWPVIASGAVALAALIVVVHDMVLFDADRFVREWGETLSGLSIDEAEFKTRARWHAGEPPCFTYAPPALTPEAIGAIADEMVAAGVLQQARATFSVWAHWAAVDERERHGDVGGEEALGFFKDAGWRARFLVRLNRAKVIAAVQRTARAGDVQTKEQMLARQSQFSPGDVAAAQAFWRGHRLLLPAQVLFRLRPEMDKR
jgi:hypothetical protein